MNNNQQLEGQIREFILREFLPGDDGADLTSATPLVTTGILDSIATLKLVGFLEETFSISIEAFETDAEYLDTIASIARLVESKLR
jgi:acyl carrier protein